MPRSKPEKIQNQTPLSDALFRVAAIDRSGADDETRSFPIVLATESPVRTYDMERMEIVDEVLHLDGMELPNQVPMVDSHERDSVRNVLGSIREFKVAGSELVARAYFASDPESQRAYQNYRDGHLTDFSVGAARVHSEYEGRTKHVLRSRLVEGSAVVRGADPGAKALLAMRAYTDPEGLRSEIMDSKLRDLLVDRGLAADADDAATLDFIKRELDKADHGLDPKVALEAVAKLKANVERKDVPDSDDVLRAERKRVADVDAMCRTHGVEDETRRKWIADGATPDAVARSILDLKLNPPAGPVGDAKVTQDRRDKFYAAAGAALIARAVAGAGLNPGAAKDKAERVGDFDAVRRSKDLSERLSAPVDSDLQYAGLSDIARMFCEEAGVEVRKLPKQEVVRRAMSIDFLSRDGGAGYHTTGSFPQLMLDAANKTLLAAYDEAEQSYSMWVRTAPSASDYKQLNRIRFGELPDPQVVPENVAYGESSASDEKESYRVEKYGDIFSISLEAIVNDDLNAISRIPAMQGNAMRRKVNKVVYSVLTANAALSDGVALFHASSHGANLDATALSETALDVGFQVMGLQTGLSGTGTILNLNPQYLIVPRALAATAHRLVSGGVVPATVGTVPLYGPGRPRPLTVVVEGQLDAASPTAWYLAASASQVDTVELTFLQGEESPVLSREESFTVDAVKYKIRQSFAAKAIDYRGLYQGNA